MAIKYIELLKSKDNQPQLIPSYKKCERRLLSVLMATIEIVPTFRSALLSSFGYGSGKTSTYQSFMEPRYDHPDLSNLRPDGLIVCARGSTVWSAFIEAKAEDKEIATEQMETYSHLAAKLGVDSVISISNTFTTAPEELPYHFPVGRRKQRKVFHIAWPQIRTLLSQLLEDQRLESLTEVKIVHEVLRFMGDPLNGVRTFDQMSSEWPKFVDAVNIDINIKNQVGFSEIVSDWQQGRRDLLDKLSLQVQGGVRIRHKAGVRSGHDERTKVDKQILAEAHELVSEYEFLEFKQSLKTIANLKSRSLKTEFSFECPENKKSRGAVSWIAKTCEPLAGKNYYLRIEWPGYGTNETILLDDFLKFPDGQHGEHTSPPKRVFLIQMYSDARRFRNRKSFVEDVERQVTLTLENLRTTPLLN